MEEGQKIISYIDKETDLLKISVDQLAAKLSLFLTGWFVTKWILDDDKKIEDTKENYDTINQLEEAKSSFFAESIVPFLAGISLVFFNIQKLNKVYFKKVDDFDTDPVKETTKPQIKPGPSIPVPEKPKEIKINDCLDSGHIEEQISASFGFKVNDDEVEIEPAGWLANIGDLKSVYDKVRQTAMKAVIGKMSLTAFLKVLKTEVEGNDEFSGLVKSHFRTITDDVFSEFSRQYGFRMAACMGYRAAIYEGGLIDHSRPFCIERNGEVFTFDEIQKFGTPEDKYGGYSDKSTGDFNGKPNFDYDPFFDQGGHNCRHAYSYIPDRLAIHLRPELKEVFAKTGKQTANA